MIYVWKQSSGPSWRVPTGRKDGRISMASEAANLPSPLDSVAVQKQKFQAKGLYTHDLVTLLGNYVFIHLISFLLPARKIKISILFSILFSSFFSFYYFMNKIIY